MKKLIRFDRVEEIKLLAEKKYGGNFSLAVNSVMNIALDSSDFINDIDRSNYPVNGEPLSYSDALEFKSYIQSDSAKMAGLPERLLDAALVGIDASLFNERIKRVIDSDSEESMSMHSKAIFDSTPITKNCSYIKAAAEILSTWVTYNGNDRGGRKSEKNYHIYIVDNFKSCFPNYEFVNNEVVTSDGSDRIDILANCKKTCRPVIIELKVGSKSAHKQLRSYAYEFEDPILINVSESEVKNKRDGITYLTYKELGVNFDFC